MSVVAARQALTDTGWQNDVAVTIGNDGRIAAVNTPHEGHADVRVDILLPAPANAHSHAFQRAMAGLTETADGAGDDFWSWRARMYAFLEVLTPDDVEALALGVQMEMLEAGYAAIGEFHYLHHAPGGVPYDNAAETSQRIIAAAAETGIGLTLLPVLYMRGGLDGQILEGGQRRFGTDLDGFSRIHTGALRAAASLDRDARVGVAPHSLRAVVPHAFARLADLPGPRHIHVAEQMGEVEAVRAATGETPVTRLMALAAIGPSWTLVHATHASADELAAVARAGAQVALCPITEANLGDGVVDAPAFLDANGRFAIGSDSNVRVALTEELRLLDYGQRLVRRRRNPVALAGGSTGRRLFEGAARGGAAALGRDAGRIAVGQLADLLALDGETVALAGLRGDTLLDAHIFAGDDRAVQHVWSAGRHVVCEGRHVARERLAPRFMQCLSRLRAAL